MLRYKLKANDVILASDEHRDLCKELVERYNVDYTAGGSAMNVMRVIAGIYRAQSVEAKVYFTGCIGKDKFGELMNKKASEDGVIANHSIDEIVPTGTCAVCLTDQGKNRSLCAFLGASQKFRDQHLRDNWTELVEDTQLIYMSGFLIAVSPESFHLLGQHIAKSNDVKRRFCLNLSAPYVSQCFGNEISKVIQYVDILFGNDEEAKAFAQFKGYNTEDLKEIASKIACEPKIRSSINRIVVITQGDKPVIVAEQLSSEGANVNQFDVELVPDSEIVDTNGAGDAFAGGFVSQFALGAPIETCVRMGTLAAREIIKVSGISLKNLSQSKLPYPSETHWN